MFGYHLVNILLHTMVALLLLRLLRRLQVRGAPLAAAIFALHPVQVESVAWISEIKNTLSGVFCLGTIIFYFKFDETRRKTDYAIALSLFVLSLLSKTVVATLPAALLMLLWWHRGRIAWKRDVLPLMPHVLLGACLGLLTVLLERTIVGAKGAEFQFTLVDRFLIAGRAIWFYLAKLAWPQQLAFSYPRWDISQGIWWQYLFPLTALALLVVLWSLRRLSRAPLIAYLLFCATLFPALGFFNIYPFRYSFVADHFQYLACAAPISLAVAGLALGVTRMKASVARIAGPWTATLLVALLASLSWQQAGMYSDMETLWRTTISRNPQSSLAYGNLGIFQVLAGEPDNAIPNLERSIGLEDNAEAQQSLGLALEQKGLVEQAVSHFEGALKVRPDFAAAHNSLGEVLVEKGELDVAISHFQRALEFRPDYVDARFNLGIAQYQKGNLDTAIAAFQKVLVAKPGDAEAHRELGLVLLQQNKRAEAILHYRQAIAINREYVDAYNDLGSALVADQKTSEGIQQFERALQLQPDRSDVLNNLAWTLATASPTSLRNGSEAVKLAEHAAVLTNGKDAVVLNTLTAAYAQAGRFEEALGTARNLLRFAESTDSALASKIKKEMEFYKAHKALP